MTRLRLRIPHQQTPQKTIVPELFNLPLNLGQFLLGLQLEYGDPAPRLQLVGFLAWRRVGLVHHACAEFDKYLDLSFCGLSTYGNGQVQGPQLVNLILLRVSRLAATVEDIVPLLSVGTIEYPR